MRFIEFRPDGKVTAEQIALSHSQERANIAVNRPVLREMRAVAHRGLDLLASGRCDEFGDLLHAGWELRKRLAAGISTSEIDAWYARARAAGALGGKVAGAGGGGFLLLYAPRDRQGQVRNAMDGLREVPFRFEPTGTRIVLNM